MRIWIEFAKHAPLRFLSHLDLMRVWQRAIRRAALPLQYSQGFNPHPKMSFASALPVGVVSYREYLDIHFACDMQQADLDVLQSALPLGIQITVWRTVPDATPALMSLIRAALWTVPANGPSVSTDSRVQALLQLEELPVRRETKNGVKTVDIRPFIYKLEMNASSLDMLLASGGEGGAKPREVLDLLEMEAVGLQRDGLLIACGSYLQSPMSVLLKEKEVSVNAEADYYQL